MKKPLVVMLACVSTMFHSSAYADYAQGCDDPQYHQYITERFTHFEAKNRRLFDTTLRDYQLSLAISNNPYKAISELSRHLKYSAQFDPIDKVADKIDRIFEHSDELSIEQKIAGDVLDSFSNETHSVGIARAWSAYRQGAHQVAFKQLLESINVTDSAVLGSFGPDFELIRRIYRDGHVAPVVAYINKTETFWIGDHPDELRNVWRKMITAGCKIQFDTIDKIKAVELGLSR